MENTISVERKSFDRGYKNLTKKNARLFKKEFRELFGVSDAQFYRRMYGETLSNEIEKDGIEKLFNKYEVTEIWD